MEPGNNWKPWALSLSIAGGVILLGLANKAGTRAYRWLRRMLNGPHKSKVLFFPDERPICKSMYMERHGCHKTDCKYSHDEKSSFGQLMKCLLSARQSLDVCVYCFTSPELAESVIFLHKKGVRVRVITDSEQENIEHSQVANFRQNGIALRKHPSFVMHHKFVVIDKKILINGSLNWTRQAVTGNYEHLIITGDLQQVIPFQEEFEKIWKDCRPTPEIFDCQKLH